MRWWLGGTNDEPRWLVVIVVGCVLVVVSGERWWLVGEVAVSAVSGVTSWWPSAAVVVMWRDGGVMVAVCGRCR